ncbi:MAG: tetratricopeptide repeat protein [Thermodesulfobacteriota bacterium]
MTTKISRRLQSLFTFFSILCWMSPATAGAQADTPTFVSTVRYPFADTQFAEDARIVATAQARRDVLGKAGPHIENLAVVKKQKVPKESVPALAAAILEIETVLQKSYAVDQSFVFEITVKTQINPATLEAQAERFLNDRDLLKKYQDTQKKASDLLDTVSALEAESRQLTSARSEEKRAVSDKLRKAIDRLSAVAWFTRALDLASRQTLAGRIPDEAADSLIKAVTLDPEYGDAWSWLGKVYSEKSEYGRAADYYQKALKADVAARGENHPDIAVDYNRLGLARHRNGEYDLAIEAYRKAWLVQIQLLGENHPDIAATYNNMGEAYRRKGEFDRAIEYYMKDLEITLKSLGPNHPNLIATYNNLGYACHGKGDNGRAMEYFQKALEVCRISLGDNHPQTRAIMENIEFLQTGGPSAGR